MRVGGLMGEDRVVRAGDSVHGVSPRDSTTAVATGCMEPRDRACATESASADFEYSSLPSAAHTRPSRQRKVSE